MTRRELLALAAALPLAAENRNPLLLLSRDDLRADNVAAHLPELRKLADGALDKGPWHITGHRPKGIEVPEHEYYSEGPYWWPDPKNPLGSYIRRDGERNPDRFDDNHRDLGTMCTAVLTLGAGAHLAREARYAGHARAILNAWFLDPATRMNPNLEFGQAVRGHNSGRGTGIIDTVGMIHCVQGIVLLEDAGCLDKPMASALREWFASYAHWMTTSEKGLDEKKSGNNHATWWTAQIAAYSIFTDDTAMQRMAWDHYRSVLVPGQIQPDGSCPREEERTNSLSYSAFNLDAFSVLCRAAQMAGVDLWRYQAPNGASIQKALAYLTPYVDQPETWKKEQIGKFDKPGIVFPGLAAIGLRSKPLATLYQSMPRVKSAWVTLTDLIFTAEKA